MQPTDLQTVNDARLLIQQTSFSHAKVGITDLDGILRGKYMAREKLLSALETGFGFCDVILGWDPNDQLYENSDYTGWHTGYPDALVYPIPETCRRIPWENEMLFFLSEFSGKAKELCPRNILKAVIERAKNMGVFARAAAEYEFFLFNETPETVRAKNYTNLTPFTPGNFGYSIIRTSAEAQFHNDFLAMCEAMDFPLEGYHPETGPGVLEAAIEVDEILMAADKAILFKTFTKIFAQRKDLMATFMAKWSMDYPGQSGHIHISLRNTNGEHVFHDPVKPEAKSDKMRWFLGGQQMLMPDLMAMVAPTINSYSRLVPGYWAPVDNSWGIDNRTSSLRVILGTPSTQRIEYRLGSADANPYLAMAAAFGSGLWGIEHKIEPSSPITGNSYRHSRSSNRPHPTNLSEAAKRLRASRAAESLFGRTFIEHFASTREWEDIEYRRQVTDWQLRRYFEII